MAKKPEPVSEIPPATRPERAIAYAFVSVLVLSIGALVAILIAGPRASGEIWATVAILPTIGLPFAVLMLILLLILGIVRRSRAAKGDGK